MPLFHLLLLLYQACNAMNGSVINNSLLPLPMEANTIHIFPHLKPFDLCQLMQVDVYYKQLTSQYIQNNIKTFGKFFKLKNEWFTFSKFIRGMKDHTCQGRSLMQLHCSSLQRRYRNYRFGSRHIKFMEHMLFIILTHQHFTNEDTRYDIAYNLYDGFFHFGLSSSPRSETIWTMMSLVGIGHYRNNSSKYLDTNQIRQLAKLFKYAQEEYDNTDDKYNRYALFALYCVDIIHKNIDRASYLWDMVQPAYIQDFFDRNILIPKRSELLWHVLSVIVDQTFQDIVFKTKYLQLLIDHKQVLFEGHEGRIMFYALASSYYSFEGMQQFMNFMMDNELINKSSILEFMTANHRFSLGTIGRLHRSTECIEFLITNVTAVGNKTSTGDRKLSDYNGTNSSISRTMKTAEIHVAVPHSSLNVSIQSAAIKFKPKNKTRRYKSRYKSQPPPPQLAFDGRRKPHHSQSDCCNTM